MKKPLKILILLAIIFLSILFVYHNKNLPKDLEKEKIAYFETKECSIKKKGASGSDTIFHSDFDDGVDLVFTDYEKVGNGYSMYTKIKIIKKGEIISEIKTIPRTYYDGFEVGDPDHDCSVDGRFVTVPTLYKSAYPDGDLRCENGNCEILKGDSHPIAIDLADGLRVSFWDIDSSMQVYVKQIHNEIKIIGSVNQTFNEIEFFSYSLNQDFNFDGFNDLKIYLYPGNGDLAINDFVNIYLYNPKTNMFESLF